MEAIIVKLYGMVWYGMVYGDTKDKLFFVTTKLVNQCDTM